MSLWMCQHCAALQPYNESMRCPNCGGVLQFATVNQPQVTPEGAAGRSSVRDQQMKNDDDLARTDVHDDSGTASEVRVPLGAVEKITDQIRMEINNLHVAFCEAIIAAVEVNGERGEIRGIEKQGHRAYDRLTQLQKALSGRPATPAPEAKEPS